VIIGFSTSSRQASVAIISANGDLLWSGREEAPQAASGACLRMLQVGLDTVGTNLTDARLFVADLGPGSFTGVRVGVTLAKTFAFTHGVNAAGADAFDLIDDGQTVVISNKRGEWFLRRPGASALVVDVLPADEFLGYGTGFEQQTYPDAARFGALLPYLHPVEPELLVPAYLVEPSISLPKKPYGAISGR
jgi:tRNA threonylcarbamoyladenosine biosynthesis protein TsaB